MTATEALLSAARSFQSKNRFSDAERTARQVLLIEADNVEALQILGLSLAYLGRAQESIGVLEEALTKDASLAGPRVALMTLYLNAKNIEACLRHVSAADTIHKNDPEVQSHIAHIYVALRQFAEAAHHFREATNLAPENAEFLRNLAIALRDSGRELEAVDTLKHLTTLAPEDASAWANLGQIQLAHGKMEDAVTSASRVIELEPRNSTGYVLQALALAELGRGDEAEPQIIQALKIDPNNAVGHAALGFWRQEQGRFAESIESLEKAISIAPRHGFVYYNLFRARTASAADEATLAQLEEMVLDDRLHPRDKGYMHYALGKAYEDMGDFNRAFPNYNLANECAYEVWLARRPWDRKAYADSFDQTIERFSPSKMPQFSPYGHSSDLPILIVGMIRSGTSLLEQMLSNHPMVAGAGELPFWHEHETDVVGPDGDLNTTALPALSEKYLQKLRDGRSHASRVTDKLPHNYAMLGQIHAAFPNARFLHLRRNPIDNSLSVYTTAYQRPPAFAHKQENIVFAYREYQRIMDHWRQVIPPDRLLELDYEDLVEDRETWARRIVEFSGLPWDDAVLRHTENKRSVRTPSLWQVRQPIYKTSVERWRRFETWIPEFIALGSSSKP